MWHHFLLETVFRLLFKRYGEILFDEGPLEAASVEFKFTVILTQEGMGPARGLKDTTFLSKPNYHTVQCSTGPNQKFSRD